MPNFLGRPKIGLSAYLNPDGNKSIFLKSNMERECSGRHINSSGLVQGCHISSANALEIPQSCTNPSNVSQNLDQLSYRYVLTTVVLRDGPVSILHIHNINSRFVVLILHLKAEDTLDFLDKFSTILWKEGSKILEIYFVLLFLITWFWIQQMMSQHWFK